MLTRKGAYVAKLWLDGIEIFKPSGDERQSHGGSAVLIPYAGRIRGGSYTFEGEEYRFVRDSGKDSIHGFGKDRRWRILEKRGSSITFGVLLKSEGYPGVLDAKIAYSIGPRSFSTSCAVVNGGRKTVPLVVGFHPYFLAKQWNLSATGAVYQYELANRFFPTGKRAPFDFAKVDAGTGLDDEFRVGGIVRLKTERYAIVMKRHNMPYLVVFNGAPAEGRSVSVEPYTGVSDAFNNGIGLTEVRPGESFTCGYEVALTM